MSIKQKRKYWRHYLKKRKSKLGFRKTIFVKKYIDDVEPNERLDKYLKED